MPSPVSGLLCMYKTLAKRQPQVTEQLSQLLASIACVYAKGELWLNYSYPFFPNKPFIEKPEEILQIRSMPTLCDWVAQNNGAISFLT